MMGLIINYEDLVPFKTVLLSLILVDCTIIGTNLQKVTDDIFTFGVRARNRSASSKNYN